MVPARQTQCRKEDWIQVQAAMNNPPSEKMGRGEKRGREAQNLYRSRQVPQHVSSRKVAVGRHVVQDLNAV
jgi:hypothetical protein